MQLGPLLHQLYLHLSSALIFAGLQNAKQSQPTSKHYIICNCWIKKEINMSQ